MRRCCVASCFSWSDETPDILFHEFPNPKSRLYTIWNQKLLPIWEAGQEPVVCSLHFTEADYELDQTGEKFVLRQTAVPSENLTQLDKREVSMTIPIDNGKPEPIVRCRLCAKPRNLSDTVDLRTRLFPVDVFQFLSIFLEFENSEDDTTTKVICRVCATKLDEVLAFKVSCSNAFLQLNKVPPKSQTLTNQDSYVLIANDSIIDEDMTEDEPYVVEAAEEPTWRCLACTEFTGPKSVVQQHSVECKVQHKLLDQKAPNTSKKKFTNPFVSSKENTPKYLNRKYMCRFNNELQKEFPFLRLTDAKDETLLLCRICLKKFSIAYKGRGSIRFHIASRVHRKGYEKLKRAMQSQGLSMEEALAIEHVVESVEYEVEFEEVLVKTEGDRILVEGMSDLKEDTEVPDGIVESYE